MAKKAKNLVAAEARIVELEKALKEANEKARHTWTVWAGKPTGKQSDWVKGNACIALFSGPDLTAQIRGLKVGEQDVVGGKRPVLLVPKSEKTGFEFVQFNSSKVRVPGYQFELTKAEQLAAWVLEKAAKNQLMVKYPVRFDDEN